MEGKKGEKSRELQVYDLEQRRLIDAEITRRTIDFIRRNAQAGKPFYAYVPFTLVHFPTLPNKKFAFFSLKPFSAIPPRSFSTSPPTISTSIPSTGSRITCASTKAC